MTAVEQWAYSREHQAASDQASPATKSHKQPLLDFTLSPQSAIGRCAGDWAYSPTAQAHWHNQEASGSQPQHPPRSARQLFRPSSARTQSTAETAYTTSGRSARPSNEHASGTSTADHYSADRDLERAASTAASASHVYSQAARASAQTPTRGRSARAAPGTNARPARPASAGRIASRSSWESPNWNQSRVDLAVSAHAPSPPHTPTHHHSSHLGPTRDAMGGNESPHHAVGVQRHPKGQHSPHRTASEFATQPATVRHYLSNMINAPISSVASPAKRPTRRQDPEAMSQGCSSPNKWAAARASEEDRNVSSNPNSNPSVNPSSASLSARSELTPAGTPYGTPQVTPTKAAGVRHGAGISINELIRSARERLPLQQAPAAPAATDRLPGYSVGKTIGEGGFCKVRLGVHDLSGQRVAIKVIDKSKLKETVDQRRIQREISILRRLSHGCIIRLLEIVETEHFIYLVMELAQGGSLLDYVRQRKRLAEPEACFFLQQIVHSLVHCHSMEIVHRDVKLENILLDSTNHIKLIDFGLAANTMPGRKLKVHCGSPSYAAPEIVARRLYDGPPVDVWSLGVVLFGMICGHLPFHATDNKKELCQKIIKGCYNAPAHLSPEAKDLLSRMLTVVPDQRITFEQVLQHKWIQQGPAWQGASAASTFSLTGTVQLNEAAMQQLQRQGYDRDLVVESLLAGDCNAATAAYHLLQQALNMREQSAHLHQSGLQVGGSTAGIHKHSHAHMRILSRSHSAQPGIPAYRPSQMGRVSAHEQNGEQTTAHVDSTQAVQEQMTTRMRASQ